MASSEAASRSSAAERLRQRGQGGQPHGRGDHVVGALRHVDVIVGVHRLVGAAGGTEDLVRPVREHLITVHVVAGARTRLVDIHDELVPVLAGENLIGRLHDGVGQARLEPAGLLVHQSRRALDPHDRIDECGKRAQARDREVLGRAQGLDPV